MRQMISEGASNRKLIRQFVKLTPEKILRGNFPSMALLRKNEGEQKLSEVLAIILIETSLSFGDGMNKETAFDLATEILVDYYYLSLEDCFVVLNRLKRAKVFKFTINVVLNAFENYDNERLKIIDDNSYSQHLSIKEGNPMIRSSEKLASKYKVKKK